MLQTNALVSADKTDAQASLERIQNFEEAFARIRSATGIEDIEELVRYLDLACLIVICVSPALRDPDRADDDGARDIMVKFDG